MLPEVVQLETEFLETPCATFVLPIPNFIDRKQMKDREFYNLKKALKESTTNFIDLTLGKTTKGIIITDRKVFEV